MYILSANLLSKLMQAISLIVILAIVLAFGRNETMTLEMKALFGVLVMLGFFTTIYLYSRNSENDEKIHKILNENPELKKQLSDLNRAFIFTSIMIISGCIYILVTLD
ncbi:MAG: hypothetical protein COB67_00480 [SAR324 cluster bacterium]|uniref:Uncharacterized protein n=1 Tax=SAR324 cluster bacterium TaxID=2024889 RepID=A0A2A4TC68_9DELT|nr:MAG: hypothetical protein COB67_00480 [SAR324 cluster bacterium]